MVLAQPAAQFGIVDLVVLGVASDWQAVSIARRGKGRAPRIDLH
jgi:hypothetical protein